MEHVISTGTHRTFFPLIDYVEHEWCVYGNCGMQTRSRPPRTITNPSHSFSLVVGWMKGDPAPIAGYRVTLCQSPNLYLQALQRRVNAPGCPARTRLFSKDVP